MKGAKIAQAEEEKNLGGRPTFDAGGKKRIKFAPSVAAETLAALKTIALRDQKSCGLIIDHLVSNEIKRRNRATKTL